MKEDKTAVLMSTSQVLEILDPESVDVIRKLEPELTDTWVKRQIYRTETEMRISVLNDISFPTPASKYWQAVREQAVHFDGLVQMTFDIRRENLKRLKIQKEMNEAEKEGDSLRVAELQIDMDESLYRTAHIKQHAEERVREIQLWSKIKEELNDGSFDTENVNSHQAASYRKTLEIKAKMLTQHSPSADTLNIRGQHETALRSVTREGKILPFNINTPPALPEKDTNTSDKED